MAVSIVGRSIQINHAIFNTLALTKRRKMNINYVGKYNELVLICAQNEQKNVYNDKVELHPTSTFNWYKSN